MVYKIRLSGLKSFSIIRYNRNHVFYTSAADFWPHNVCIAFSGTGDVKQTKNGDIRQNPQNRDETVMLSD